MPEITITISDEELEKLREIAIRLRVRPEDLVRVTVTEFLALPDEEMDEVMTYLLDKNADLYERLA